MGSSPLDVSTLRELYTTPPAEFVAARTRLVKERRAAKDRETATALGKLRRPGLADWALNVVAVEHGDDIAAFVEAASAVRDAQAAAIEGRAGPDVRDALRELREQTGRVLAAAQGVLFGAGKDAAAQVGAVAGRLAEVAGSEEASTQLAAGVLGSAGVEAVELFGEIEPTARPQPRRATAGRRTSRSVSPKTASTTTAVTQTRKERERALRQTTRARDDAAKAEARASTAVEKAAAAVRNAERRLATAQDALTAAEQEREAAARRLAQSEESRRQAQDALDAATS